MALVHRVPIQLWSNIVFQLYLGILLEVTHHWLRVSALYATGILGGSLAIMTLNLEEYGIGSSAGVYALLMAHLSTIVMVIMSLNFDLELSYTHNVEFSYRFCTLRNWKEIELKCYRMFCLIFFVILITGLDAFFKLKTNLSGIHVLRQYDVL